LVLGSRTHNARKSLREAKTAFAELTASQGRQGISSVRALDVILRAYAILIKASGAAIQEAENYISIAEEVLRDWDSDKEMHHAGKSLRASLAQILLELSITAAEDDKRAALMRRCLGEFKKSTNVSVPVVHV
jgi:hypothetical protein